MIIIVEGPRGSGKTTMCHDIRRAFDAQGIPVELYKADRTDDPHGDMMRTFAVHGPSNTVYIWDRGPLTEFVMSHYYSRRTDDDLMASLSAEFELLLEHDSLIMQMVVTATELRARYDGRADGRGMDVPSHEVSFVLWSLLFNQTAAAYPYWRAIGSTLSGLSEATVHYQRVMNHRRQQNKKGTSS